MVPLQLMSISGKELHVSVLPLHVPEARSWAGVILTGSAGGCEASG